MIILALQIDDTKEGNCSFLRKINKPVRIRGDGQYQHAGSPHFRCWPFSKPPFTRYQLLVILISCSPIPVKAQSSNIYESLDNP